MIWPVIIVYFLLGILFLVARRHTISQQNGMFAFVFVFYILVAWPFFLGFKFIDVLFEGDL